MEAFEWEDRDHHTPILVHMIAGSLAGMSEHLSMIPIDNVKTHCQAGKQYTISHYVSKIYKSGGLRNFYAGSSIVAFGCAPAHAIYFSIYQKALQVLQCKPEEDFGKFAFVGALSAMFHDLIMTPTETLKQRVQLMRSENLKTPITKIASLMLKKEGLVSFYRSFPINYAMNIPFGSLIVALNEKLKYLMGVQQQNLNLKYYLCGALAGAIASIPTTPLDVIKTKLNTQNCTDNKCEKVSFCNMLKHKHQRSHQSHIQQQEHRYRPSNLLMQNRQAISTYRHNVKYRNVWDTTLKIMQEDGLLGFFKGFQMRMMIQSISSGVAWGTYHIIKDFLSQEFRE